MKTWKNINNSQKKRGLQLRLTINYAKINNHTWNGRRTTMNRKKALIVILAGLMSVSVCACNKQKTNEDKKPSTSTEKETSKSEFEEYVTAKEKDFLTEKVEGGVKITLYDGKAKSIIIPDKIEGQDVLEVGTKAFPAGTVERVKLPDTLQVVRPGAFSSSDKLIVVEMGKNVKRIDDDAFHGCTNLSDVTLNEGLKEIGQYAFMQCRSLKQLEIPKHVKKIEHGAFAFAGLEEIEIPGSVKVVGDEAFGSCSALKKVILHEGIETVESGAFSSCEKLKKAELAASITTYESNIFEYCPDVVVYLYKGSPAEEYAKEHEYKIEIKTTQPEPVPEEEIEEDEVRNYVQPEESDFLWKDTENGVIITEYKGINKNIIVPSTLGGKNVVSFEKSAFWGERVEGIKLPDTITEIGENSLSYLKTLSEVELGKGVKVIGKGAFSGTYLKKIVLNEGLEVIEDGAFSHCDELKNIVFPNTLVEIKDSAFWNCGFEEVTIPGNVKIIGEDSFRSCESLKKVVLEDGVQEIQEKAFSGCSALERIEIPASATTINNILTNEIKAVISAPAGSQAEEYAKQYNYKFEAK